MLHFCTHVEAEHTGQGREPAFTLIKTTEFMICKHKALTHQNKAKTKENNNKKL
jgi:hypothetical protein